MLNTEQRRQYAKPGCVIWLGGATTGGYGERGFRKQNWYVHRLSWAIENGPIPKGLSVLHRCDVRRCFNTDHLFLGTQADNQADIVRKGRSARGEKNSRAKLTSEEVDAIRLDPRPQKQIAKQYGIVQQHVSNIKKGRRWGWR